MLLASSLVHCHASDADIGLNLTNCGGQIVVRSVEVGSPAARYSTIAQGDELISISTNASMLFGFAACVGSPAGHAADLLRGEVDTMAGIRYHTTNAFPNSSVTNTVWLERKHPRSYLPDVYDRNLSSLPFTFVPAPGDATMTQTAFNWDVSSLSLIPSESWRAISNGTDCVKVLGTIGCPVQICRGVSPDESLWLYCAETSVGTTTKNQSFVALTISNGMVLHGFPTNLHTESWIQVDVFSKK
jgi:hypothetical protein